MPILDAEFTPICAQRLVAAQQMPAHPPLCKHGRLQPPPLTPSPGCHRQAARVPGAPGLALHVPSWRVRTSPLPAASGPPRSRGAVGPRGRGPGFPSACGPPTQASSWEGTRTSRTPLPTEMPDPDSNPGAGWPGQTFHCSRPQFPRWPSPRAGLDFAGLSAVGSLACGSISTRLGWEDTPSSHPAATRICLRGSQRADVTRLENECHFVCQLQSVGTGCRGAVLGGHLGLSGGRMVWGYTQKRD